MGLGEERDHRNSPASQHALHLAEMAEARDRRPPAPSRRATARDGRQLAEEHLVDTDREMGLELPGEEVELRRAAFHEQDFDRPVDGGRPHPGQAQDAHRQVVGGHSDGGRPDDHIFQEPLTPSG